MAGYQFAHMESFSRKADKKGRSVSFVLDEVSREPSSSVHVHKPKEPILLYGLDIETLRKQHDDQVADTVASRSDGKTRKLRVDQHTIMTVILSHPFKMEEIESDEEKEKLVKRWEQENINWLTEKYGSQLKTVVRHDDESHPHLHVYLFSEDGQMKAKTLNPGESAKNEAFKVAISEGDDTKTANKKGDRAYKAAMREWQDDYYNNVGIPCGLTRVGPHKRSISKSTWIAEKAHASNVANLLDIAGNAQKEIDTAMKAKAYLEHCKQQVVLLKEQAKAAIAAADNARKQEAKILDNAKKKASNIILMAEKKADGMKRIGSILGKAVFGFSGIEKAIHEKANKKVAEAELKASQLIQSERKRIQASVLAKFGTEIKTLKSDLLGANEAAAAAEREAKSLRQETRSLKGELVTNRIELAEVTREREDFRGRWADADNKLQANKGNCFQ